MPIILPDNFPALNAFSDLDLFIMKHDRAIHQDIRPLKILILNLMPKKIETETMLLRLLSNTLIQLDITFIHPKTHESKTTDPLHMAHFYKTFDEIKDKRFDGMIITGAPVENMAFEDVTYWDELTEIMDYADEKVTSTFFICWGAQAGLYHFYDIPKHPLKEKMFGVFDHYNLNPHSNLLRGFNDIFTVPHSRHTETKRLDVENIEELEILSESSDAGVYLIANKTRSKVFATGHIEYDTLTLHEEYTRDKGKGLDIKVPHDYYPNDNYNFTPSNTWRGHANLLFSNWLNYCVYQITDYILD